MPAEASTSLLLPCWSQEPWPRAEEGLTGEGGEAWLLGMPVGGVSGFQAHLSASTNWLCPCDSVNPLTDSLTHSLNTPQQTSAPGITVLPLRAWVKSLALTHQLCDLGHIS